MSPVEAKNLPTQRMKLGFNSSVSSEEAITPVTFILLINIAAKSSHYKELTQRWRNLCVRQPNA